ncbi:MAG TPA: DUF3347 domain-containing protein [Sphingobacteriaceae bacterium]|nr:DUF3347 domain-containing protein [Sphingobacteriaceae bacterium]
MKNNLKIISLTVLVSTVILGCSTDSGKNNKSKNTEKSSDAHSLATVTFKDDKIKSIYTHYIHLKDALVKSDEKTAQSAASELQSALTNAGKTNGAVLAGKISAKADIKVQRAEFNMLTSEIEGMISSGAISAGKIYKQYCPMAYEGNGAYWLASEPEIRNPYYGDEMLECGEVKKEIMK